LRAIHHTRRSRDAIKILRYTIPRLTLQFVILYKLNANLT